METDYKILAKLLAKRIVGMLDSILLISQIGFIKGGYILENLMNSWEAMKWGKDNKQNVCMVLFDFEKAYDRIEWDFVLKIFERLGFPPSFCRWVDILFKDSNTIIQVNGELSNPIFLERSIRQGCPLAPSLFVLVADALSYIMNSNKLGLGVKGILLPNKDNLLLEQFATDIAMFLELLEENFENMLSRLQLFCNASSAKISTQKSSILGWSTSSLDWIRNQEWQWYGPNHIVRYLGIFFSVKPSMKDTWN